MTGLQILEDRLIQGIGLYEYEISMNCLSGDHGRKIMMK